MNFNKDFLEVKRNRKLKIFIRLVQISSLIAGSMRHQKRIRIKKIMVNKKTRSNATI